eukprot:9580831-Ditylum_brightwellii.AAC.1
MDEDAPDVSAQPEEAAQQFAATNAQSQKTMSQLATTNTQLQQQVYKIQQQMNVHAGQHYQPPMLMQPPAQLGYAVNDVQQAQP